MAMDTFDDFVQVLSEALTHLYDPAYHPPPELITALIAVHPDETGSLQKMIAAAIRRLQPDAEVPLMARSRRLYELLACRYIQELTQEETAKRLGSTPRHLRREQKQAINLLAQGLWTNWRAAKANAEASAATETTQPAVVVPAIGDEQAEAAWRSQVVQELAVLEASDPGVIADVGTVIEQVARLKEKVVAHRDAALVIETLSQPLTVSLHPSLLRQLLIVAIQKLAQAMTQGVITVRVAPNDAYINFRIAGAPIAPDVRVASEFIDQTVAARGGDCTVERRGDTVEFCIRLPQVEYKTLLVVDDNEDIAHVYRRYLERTRLRVVHVHTGKEALAQIPLVRPDVAVLDVMLPDIDGWEVLSRLHEQTETRTIPIIVCSVVRQEELALALGAVQYLSKPVRRTDLIQALEKVLALDSKAVPKAPTNTTEAC